jgi:hypothetical protein
MLLVQRSGFGLNELLDFHAVLWRVGIRRSRGSRGCGLCSGHCFPLSLLSSGAFGF